MQVVTITTKYNINTLSCSTRDSSNLFTLRTNVVLVFFSLILNRLLFLQSNSSRYIVYLFQKCHVAKVHA